MTATEPEQAPTLFEKAEELSAALPTLPDTDSTIFLVFGAQTAGTGANVPAPKNRGRQKNSVKKSQFHSVEYLTKVLCSEDEVRSSIFALEGCCSRSRASRREILARLRAAKP